MENRKLEQQSKPQTFDEQKFPETQENNRKLPNKSLPRNEIQKSSN